MKTCHNSDNIVNWGMIKTAKKAEIFLWDLQLKKTSPEGILCHIHLSSIHHQGEWGGVNTLMLFKIKLTNTKILSIKSNVSWFPNESWKFSLLLKTLDRNKWMVLLLSLFYVKVLRRREAWPLYLRGNGYEKLISKSSGSIFQPK